MSQDIRASTWPAPAKLNLFLHITGRRPDGYHLLQTVFQFISLGDEIDFRITRHSNVRRLSDMPGLTEEDDLVVRAARLLQQHTGNGQGVEISVHKRIPEGGGLGGGSSDAATTLVALNQLWQLGLKQSELARLGLQLGADVPVFVHGHAAWAEGVGENLTSIEPEEKHYLVIHPGCHVSTMEIFNAADLTRNTPAITIRDFLERGGNNDCEPAVRKRYIAVARALDWLNQYAPARLTGTGACLFAAFDTEAEAQGTKSNLPDDWQGFVVYGMNQSPLLSRLAQERQLED